MHRAYYHLDRVILPHTRRYVLRVFKRDCRRVYGGKVHSGSLRDMCALALRLFPPSTQCCAVAPGRYLIGGGLAELEVIR